MISLFNIPKKININVELDHILHGSIVTEFEQSFANYVGAKHALGLSSACAAIFFSILNYDIEISLPSCIPPVVPNYIILSGNKVKFNDNTNWIGGSYILHDFGSYKIIDSAQRVDRDQFKNEANPNDLMIFSHYPTKPVPSWGEGGTIVSNNKTHLNAIRLIAYSGMQLKENSWDREQTAIGYKMYMNSLQAYFANESLKKLDQKQKVLKEIRDIYNESFGLDNSSYHLYRVSIANNRIFLKKMKEVGITCGIHYEPCHKVGCFLQTTKSLPMSEKVGVTTASLPFHEALTENDVKTVIKFTKKFINAT